MCAHHKIDDCVVSDRSGDVPCGPLIIFSQFIVPLSSHHRDLLVAMKARSFLTTVGGTAGGSFVQLQDQEFLIKNQDRYWAIGTHGLKPDR